VVDDDGIGYKDDGEEHWGAEDPDAAKKRALEDEIGRDDSKNIKRLKKLTQGDAASQKNTMLNYTRGMMPVKEKAHSNEAVPGMY
jgi:hypothetical protein